MIEHFKKTLKSLSAVPDLKKAIFISVENGIHKVEAYWNVQDVEGEERINLISKYLYQDTADGEVQNLLSSVADKRVILTAVDSSGKKSAIISQDDDICHLIIASESCHTVSFNIKAKDVHSKVYSDAELSSLAWSPDSLSVAYIAEKLQPKKSTFFSKTEKDDEARGEKFAYLDDWGEQMTGQHQSVVAVLSLKTDAMKTLELPEGVCGGQVVWAPDGEGVVGVAFVTVPYRLGLIYCRNRESFLFHLDMQNNFRELTERGYHVQMPRFSPDGSKIVFLQSPMGGPHVRSAQLCILDWKKMQAEVLVDYVLRPMDISATDKFYGLCGSSILPLKCWTSDSKKIVFSALGYYGFSSYIIDIDTKKIVRVSLNGDAIVHDVVNDKLLLSSSTCTEPHRLVLCDCSNAQRIVPISPVISVDGIPVEWTDTWNFVNKNPHPVAELSSLPIPVIYLGPTKLMEGEGKRSLIVWVHGGPHSLVTNRFNVGPSFFAKLGYSVIFPNYRGSLGQGKDSLESLPGNCGNTDVDDVYQATIQALERYKDVLDPTKVVLIGGSHGGFLVLHLAAQYPDVYKVVSTRNPVVDVSSMASISDIPDWCFVESGYSFETGRHASEDKLIKMQKISPISKIDHVKAPILFLLGKNDRRVPMSQGLMYYKVLLARKIPTKAYVYEDTHSLAKVDVEADCLIHTAMWFKEHL